ncbi:MAG: type II toxin-antitoxin system PemK/MazF family toxin [Opitutae bacterium]|nr:type II toxin-antitoxin system PemK/MazF family toxin [Opitutae bacterium]
MESLNYRRGDVVTCAPPGDYGKPRPAVVLQSDLFNATHASVSLCPATSHVIEAALFRITLRPSPANGLKTESQAMADKITTLRRGRIGAIIGRLEPDEMARVESAVSRWLGLQV